MTSGLTAHTRGVLRQSRRAVVAALLALGGTLLPASSGAAERTGPVRIGALTVSWGPTPGVIGLRDGLLALGYREHEQFVIGVRFTQGDVAGLAEAARELVQHGVDIIYAADWNAAKAAQAATTQIPIVFTLGADPVGHGLIQSFASPGGNITGVTDLHLELGAKRLEVFREIIPSLRRVLFIYDSSDPLSVPEARAYRDAARRLGMELVEKPVRTPAEAQTTLARLRRGEVDGILAPRSLSSNIPGFVLEATSKLTIPTMFDLLFWTERGGLASYGPDLYELGRQAARLVDKILKGANPAGIPVEVGTKIEFAVNAKVARTLGLTIPPEVLYRADRIFR